MIKRIIFHNLLSIALYASFFSLRTIFALQRSKPAKKPSLSASRFEDFFIRWFLAKIVKQFEKQRI